jgi:phage baseplate assembly protein W
LVLTNEFDRPFHPEIASHVRDLLFQPFTAITYNLLRNRIDKVLEIYEPRAKLTRIEIDDREFQNMDNNTLSVKIFFTLLNAPTNEENVDIMLERIR